MTKVCDICKNTVIGKYHSLILKEKGKVIALNGHKECIEKKKEELERPKTRSYSSVPEVSIVGWDKPICKPLPEYAEKLSGNYPPKPNIVQREIDDWYENEKGLVCRIISPNAEKHIEKLNK